MLFIDKEIEHLAYIKNNPNCNTKPDCLDGFIIEDLINKGFLRGIRVTHLGSKAPEYIDIAITFAGEDHLSLFNTKPQPTNNTVNKEISHKGSEWHNKPLGKIIIGVAVGIIILIVTFALKHFNLFQNITSR